MVMYALKMPRLGETMDEGRIVRWLKAPGETFERGEVMIEIETDKTLAEYPALWSGKVVDLVRQEGELVTVGETIAHLEVPGPLKMPATGRTPPEAEPELPGSEAGTDRPQQKPSQTERSYRPRATPLARRLIDLARNAVGPMGQRMDIVASLAVLSKEMPVRVILGVQDKIIPWQQIVALPPTVAIHLMAASGHMPQWDQTRDVLDIITGQWMGGAQ